MSALSMYDVFISYSRKDATQATKIYSELSSFRLPKLATIRNKKLSVFKDIHDLLGADYYDSIEKYLSRSTKFVLLCSSNSIDSEFVNDEVTRFCSIRDPRDVILVMLEGPPSENQFAFVPKVIKTHLENPLFIDFSSVDFSSQKYIRKQSYSGWMGLLSSITDTERSDFEQREKRAKWMRGIVTSSVIALLISSGITALYYYFNSIHKSALELGHRILEGSYQAFDQGDMDQSIRLAIAAARTVKDAEKDKAANMQIKRALIKRRLTSATFSPVDPIVGLWSANSEHSYSNQTSMHLGSSTVSINHIRFEPEINASNNWILNNEVSLFTSAPAELDLAHDGNWKENDLTKGSDSQLLGISSSNGHIAMAKRRQGSTITVLERVDGNLNESTFETGSNSGTLAIDISNSAEMILTVDGADRNNIYVWTKSDDDNWTSELIQAHSSGVTSLNFYPKGELFVSTSKDRSAKVWWKNDENKWSHISLIGHSGTVISSAISTDERFILTVSEDKSARIWEFDRDLGMFISETLTGHTDRVLGGFFSGDGRKVFTFSDDLSLKVWEKVDDEWMSETIRGHSDTIHFVASSYSGQEIMTVANGGSINFWSLESKNKNTMAEYNVANEYFGTDNSVKKSEYDSVYRPNRRRSVLSASSVSSGVLFNHLSNEIEIAEFNSNGESSIIELMNMDVGEYYATISHNGRVVVVETVELIEPRKTVEMVGPDGMVNMVEIVEEDEAVATQINIFHKTDKKSWMQSELPVSTTNLENICISNNGGLVMVLLYDDAASMFHLNEDKWELQVFDRAINNAEFCSIANDNSVAGVIAEDGQPIILERRFDNTWNSSLLTYQDEDIVTSAIFLSSDGNHAFTVTEYDQLYVWGKDDQLKWIPTFIDNIPDYTLEDAFSISSGSNRVAMSGSSDYLAFWSLEHDGAWKRTKVVDESHRYVGISSDGEQIATISYEDVVELWTKNGQNWIDIKLPSSQMAIDSIYFNSKDRKIVGSGEDGLVFWNNDFATSNSKEESYVEMICDHTTNSVSSDNPIQIKIAERDLFAFKQLGTLEAREGFNVCNIGPLFRYPWYSASN